MTTEPFRAPGARWLPAAWRARYDAAWRLMRADRPIGWLLLLWPTLMALWLAAEGWPPVGPLLVFVAGVWLTRSAGCVINDYADRWLDGQVRRTKARPLVAGELSGRFALGLFAALMLAAFGLVLLTNAKTVLLSGVALLLAAAYPYMKRHTWLPQVWLGLAFSWGIPMAYTAVRDVWPPQEAWLLLIANLLWTTAYDTWYAMVDREDDRRAGAKSTALLFGDLDIPILAALYALFGLCLVLLGQRLQLGTAYWLGLAVAAAFVVRQFQRGRSRHPEDCFAAFLGNNAVGAALFGGVALHYFIAAG
ncbi:4-hydroxybenzoate octaprenyltransferase [Silanimonas lenta]|uniref:4-hydroxybenzoate octaprenyltransferase n=1 Tax=Silanimonas lenta TaxID=265429 RepID=UPI00040E8FFB|nr:4-hydroxybenzoate octaprenyltransferase [Silanimonas lenta]